MSERLPLQRRTFLKATAMALVGTWCIPKKTIAKIFEAPERCLCLYHAHTGEFLKTIYWAKGTYLPESLQHINYFLRDYRNQAVQHIDTTLIDVLYTLSLKLETKQPFQIISAYRSPKTNAVLRKKSRGVAKHSYHTKGQAVDIRLPHIGLKHLHHAALSLQSGGVGYYGRSRFIHIDTGPVRKWNG